MQVLRWKRQSIVFVLGFVSGLPLLLSGSTLQAWFVVAGIPVSHIGLLSLIGAPYVYKFLWAPLLDRYSLCGTTRRRGWIVLCQILVIVVLLYLAQCDPAQAPLRAATLALALAFCSASQDIAINAYQTELLTTKEQSFGATLSAMGYRVALLVSGGLALVLADYWGFGTVYQLMALLLLIGVVIVIIAPEPTLSASRPVTLATSIIEPFKEFISRPAALLMIVAVFFYKIGGDFVLVLNTTFFLKGLNFTLSEVGAAYKIMSFSATIVGLLMGGAVLEKVGLYRGLYYFAWMQALAILLYFWLATVGKHFIFMLVAVFGEYTAEGMGTAALLAWIMSLCNQRYTATQFALLSALASIGRVVLGPLAGLIATHWGWAALYAIGFIAAMPSILLAYCLLRRANCSRMI